MRYLTLQKQISFKLLEFVSSSHVELLEIITELQKSVLHIHTLGMTVTIQLKIHQSQPNIYTLF